MDHVIAKMRLDFETLAEARAAAGEWDPDYERSVGLAIKWAIDTQELPMIAAWCHWLAIAVATSGSLPAVPVRGQHLQGCLTCAHRSTRYSADALGHCVQRNDLPAAYGPEHPLQQLPADLGLSCQLRAGVEEAPRADQAAPTASPIPPGVDRQQWLRENLPTVALAVDEWAAVFGRDGLKVAWASENGHVLGRPGPDGVKLSDTVVGRMFPEKAERRR